MFPLALKYSGLQLLVVFWVRNSWGLEYHSFQNIIVCRTAHNPGYPSSIQDIQLIVKYAIARKLSVKPIGRLHSATDIICTDGILLIMHKINHIQYDRVSKTVRVGGGCTVKELTEYLHQKGRALHGLPAFGEITVAGALGTGAHGSSLTRPSTLSDQMVRVTFVDGLGAIVNTSDPDLLSAFKAHLGLLGIIYEVTLETVPQFKVRFYNYPLSDTILTRTTRQLKEMARSRDYFHFWWFPTTQRVVIAEGTVVSTHAVGECQTNFIRDISPENSVASRNLWASGNNVALFILELISTRLSYRQVPGFDFIYSKANRRECSARTGYSHKMLSNTCEKCAWGYGPDSLDLKEFSIVIPLDNMESAVATINHFLHKYPTQFPVNGMFFRFMKASNGLMSVNRNRDSVAIEWVALNPPEKYRHATLGITSRQAIQQALIEKHQGRAHWGKNGLYFSSPEMIHLQHGQHHKRFVKYMSKLDPHGVFLNPFGRRVRFGSSDYIPDSRVKHCALHDNCLCASNSDCGDDVNINLKCGKISNYTVCVEQLAPMRIFWKGIASGMIKQFVQPMSNWRLQDDERMLYPHQRKREHSQKPYQIGNLAFNLSIVERNNQNHKPFFSVLNIDGPVIGFLVYCSHARRIQLEEVISSGLIIFGQGAECFKVSRNHVIGQFPPLLDFLS